MLFKPTTLDDCWVMELEPHRDERGFLARSFCKREFAEHGLETSIAQCNVSYNKAVHTLRGLHFQAAPHQEAKVVSCIRGAIHDVVVDLRPHSKTYRKWFAIRLAADTLTALYVPRGFAHGFLTLSADAIVHYYMFSSYSPDSASGVRWDDPALGIDWPHPPAVISERDRSFSLLEKG